jgi:Uri superfamily endonuclease
MKGTYILLINLRKNLNNVRIGKLGKLNFKKGFYCYVGSAVGKNINLEKRLMRHLSGRKKLRWHIDYLLSKPGVGVEGIVILQSKEKIECLVSRFIENYAESVVKNFGSTDCGCDSHLYYFEDKKFLLMLDNIF